MKHRLTDGCLNPYKHHLWRLPSIPEDKWIESYDGDSRECIAVYPLFSILENDASLEHHLVRAASWGRRSFLLFSDAIDLDIKIGFYVGNKVTDRVFPLLEENGIDTEKDVFIMNEDKFKGDPVTHLGKKMSIFCDEQFLDYKWVVQFDCDMWLGSPNKKSFNFFQYIITHDQNGVGAVKAWTEGFDPPFFDVNQKCWWHKLLDTDSKNEKIEAWMNRARELVGDVVEAYQDESRFVTDCHGGIYAFPIQHYHEEHPDLVDWIARAGKALQDDEAVFSLWNMMGESLFSITHETDIPFFGDILNYQYDRDDVDGVYFSHLGNLSGEWFWRADADAL